MLALAVPLPAAGVTPSPSPTTATPAGTTPASTPATTQPPLPSTSSPASGPAPLPVTVVMTNLTPIAPQPGDVVRITGTLHNSSAAPVTDLQLQLHYRSKSIGSRSEFDDYAIGSRTGPGGDFGPLPLPAEVASTASSSLANRTLAPAATEPFSLAIRVDDLHLATGTWQVYEIGVGVNGLTVDGFIAVGGLRTFLPFAPLGVPGVGQQTQVAWMWPLVDRPHRTVGDTWADDSLARELSAGGRLANLLFAGQAAQDQHPAPPPRKRKHRKVKPVVPTTSVPVTWAVDPLLVDDVSAMAAGYKVGTGRAPKAGTGKDEAGAWLTCTLLRRTASTAPSLIQTMSITAIIQTGLKASPLTPCSKLI